MFGDAGDGVKSWIHPWALPGEKGSLAVLLQECGKSWFMELFQQRLRLDVRKRVFFQSVVGGFPRE